jgi:glycosyltransferase involved in cell wall biosynthesis
VTVLDHRQSTDVVELPIDVSVVMPCLNEEESVAECVAWALEGLARTGLRGEVVVSDNGSTDRSVEVATAAGARVVHQPERGYGNAYLKGFAEAKGRIIVMGDSDCTYDFRRLDELVAPLVRGEKDYMLGSRFSGEIKRGAMTFSHRYIGNPVLTSILNLFFGLKSSDAHSGMRAFTREAYERMDLRCEGMEFASEIVIKAGQQKLRVGEVPIEYHPRVGETKLRTFRDGWRHLRFMLLLAPNWLFLYPGMALFLLGMVGQSVLLSTSITVAGHQLNNHVSALFALVALLGFQAMVFAAFAHAWADSLGLDQPSAVALWVRDGFTLERGLLVGAAFFVTGLVVDVYILLSWIADDFGELAAIRPALFAMTLMVLGGMMAFASFFLGLLKVKVRVHAPAANGS